MAEKLTVARPYANAVFELAQTTGTLAEWSEALDGLVQVSRVPAVAALIDSPQVAAGKRAAILVEIVGDVLGPHGKNLVRVLSEKKRLGCLPEIAHEYEALRRRAEAVVDVEMRTAIEVKQDRQTTITEGLKRKLGRDVRLHCVVDDKVIGGAVFRAGDIVIDDSIRSRLDKLAAAMTL